MFLEKYMGKNKFFFMIPVFYFWINYEKKKIIQLYHKITSMTKKNTRSIFCLLIKKSCLSMSEDMEYIFCFFEIVYILLGSWTKVFCRTSRDTSKTSHKILRLTRHPQKNKHIWTNSLPWSDKKIAEYTPILYWFFFSES